VVREFNGLAYQFVKWYTSVVKWRKAPPPLEPYMLKGHTCTEWAEKRGDSIDRR